MPYNFIGDIKLWLGLGMGSESVFDVQIIIIIIIIIIHEFHGNTSLKQNFRVAVNVTY